MSLPRLLALTAAAIATVAASVASIRGGNVLGASARARVVVRGRGQNACAAARSAC